MRPQQNRRIRGRTNNNNSNNNNNNRRGPNPLTRNYESSGPDVKIRGNAQHIADKYLTLSRDAHASGDRVMAENYLQHAEHYTRIILSAQSYAQHTINRDNASADNTEIATNSVAEMSTDDVAENEHDDNILRPALDNESSDVESTDYNKKARDRSFNGRKTNGLRRNTRQQRPHRNNEREFELVTSSSDTPQDDSVIDTQPQELSNVSAPALEQANVTSNISNDAAEDNQENFTQKPRASKTRSNKTVEEAVDNNEDNSAVKPRRKRRVIKVEAQPTEA